MQKRLALFILAMMMPAPLGALAQPAETMPDAFAVSGSKLSFFDTPNRRHTVIPGGDAAMIGHAVVDLKEPSHVLVLFTSGVATVEAAGCPCSVRASLSADDQAPIVVKRINLTSGTPAGAAPYIPDRQSLDGSYVFSLPRGRHDIKLTVQRIDGASKMLHVFYVNLQALVFPQDP